jgi:valyl-tRNA synthetase
MGWPDETEDLKKFYPSNVLVTAFDILFFWVARMIIMGMEFINEIPFHHVLLHGLLRDEKGEKMSRTKGNAIDPMDAINEHGRDVLRFMLNHHSFRGKQDFTMSPDRLKGARFFINKLWNASKFVIMNLGDDFEYKNLEEGTVAYSHLDSWFMNRMDKVIEEYTHHMENYDFGFASNLLYSFFWDEFCDWYLEGVKRTLYGEDEQAKESTKQILYYMLTTILKLYSPVIPFVTEEIYRELPGTKSESLTVQPWPKALKLDVIESQRVTWKHFGLVMELTKATRNLRKETGLPDSKAIDISIRLSDDARAIPDELWDTYNALANVSERNNLGPDDPRPERALFNLVKGTEIFLTIEDTEPLKAELDKLAKKIQDKNEYIEYLEEKLGNEKFLDFAPDHVVDAEFDKLASAKQDLKELKNRHDRLKEVLD